jgi:hypothetical protein
MLEGVGAHVIYKAVMLDLVYAHLTSDEERATYRYYLLDAGRSRAGALYGLPIGRKGRISRHPPGGGIGRVCGTDFRVPF